MCNMWLDKYVSFIEEAIARTCLYQFSREEKCEDFHPLVVTCLTVLSKHLSNINLSNESPKIAALEDECHTSLNISQFSELAVRNYYTDFRAQLSLRFVILNTYYLVNLKNSLSVMKASDTIYIYTIYIFIEHWP